MKNRFLPAMCLTLALTAAVSALAEPIMTDGTHTAYLGDNNYLYLTDDQGSTKMLRSPILDLVGMDAEHLYCLSDTGRLYGIKLDGTSTFVAAAQPTDEDFAKVTSMPVFTLENSTLTLTQGDQMQIVSENAIAAFATADTLYYVEANYGSAIPVAGMAKTFTLTSASLLPRDPAQPESGAPVNSHIVVPETLSLTANNTGLVTLVTADHQVVLVDLTAAIPTPVTLPANSLNTVKAYCTGSMLYRYALDEKDLYVVESYETLDQPIGSSQATSGVAAATNRPVVTAAPTEAPRATSAAKATAKPTSKPTAAPTEDDGSIHFGAKGKDVRKMQQRLADLGYLQDKVDGTFGKNTLRALNLFQTAVGYKERNYATESLLNKLNSKKAPAFDLYRPLKKGDKNTYVLMMQEALNTIGYKLEKLDGNFGTKTFEAVAAFQRIAMGLPESQVTGEADVETLKGIYWLFFNPTTPTDLN